MPRPLDEGLFEPIVRDARRLHFIIASSRNEDKTMNRFVSLTLLAIGLLDAIQQWDFGGLIQQVGPNCCHCSQGIPWQFELGLILWFLGHNERGAPAIPTTSGCCEKPQLQVFPTDSVEAAS